MFVNSLIRSIGYLDNPFYFYDLNIKLGKYILDVIDVGSFIICTKNSILLNWKTNVPKRKMVGTY